MRKILLFCVLAVSVMFLLSGCKITPTTPETPTTPAAETPETPAAETPETPAATPTEIFSDLKCVDGKLEVTVYNIGAEKLKVGQEITFIVNGLVANPKFMECTPGAELEAGASATCVITPVKALGAENTVRISEKLAGEVKQETELVTCSTAAAETTTETTTE